MIPFRNIFIGVIVLFVVIVAIGAAPASSAEPQTDLYRVYIHSQKETDLLASLPVDPVWRLGDGYLVLIEPNVADRLTSSGLRCEMVSGGVDRRSLAFDRRIDLPKDSRFDVVFQQGGTRICRIDPAGRAERTVAARFFPIHDRAVPIVYRPPLRLDKSVEIPTDDLDSLVSRVQEDSIVSYSEFLQSLDGRLTMTSGTRAARNWLIDKFHEFGYDSVVTDTFSGPGRFEYEFVTGHNVIAYKIGTENPYHHIVIGAHYDAAVDMHDDVSLSPGADDNGSGVVAVMEIARALKNVDTRQTIVFILFDAEEEGLVGSYGYTDRASKNNDRIAFMLNMDMIGYYENDSDVTLCWGADSTSAELWESVAASLAAVNLTAHPEPGNLSSDDIPFTEFGYRTLGVHEYIFSTVYHSYQDSTTYLNFDYLTRVTQVNLAAAYVFDQQYVPDYELWMAFSEPTTDIIMPNVPNALDVKIREYGGSRLVPGSVTLHYSVNDGEPQSIVAENITGDLYRGILPALPCLDNITYYVTAVEDSLGDLYLPADGKPILAYSATGMTDIFYDDFSSDKGWTTASDAIEGEWQRTGQLYGYAEPFRDYDGSGMCYTTDSSYYHDVDNGTVSLISPLINATTGVVFVEYARWYSNSAGPAPNSDVFNVFLSSNGGTTWHFIETVGPVEEASGGWFVHKTTVGDHVTPTSQVRIRFDASDTKEDSFVEAAVDAVRFSVLSTDLHVITESVPSWTAYYPYSQQLEAAVCAEPVTWTDRFGQLEGTGLTLSEDGLLTGIPTRFGPIVFRAQATDEFGGSDEQILSFIIYDTLRVTTADIPSASIGESYSSQLTVSGGTGTKTWSDRDGDLAETGVALSSDGLLTGTPDIEGDFPFTALVTDQVGATTEKAFTLRIVGPYVCGDADGDSTVDISDAVYVINYIFKSGASPYPIEAGDANADGAVDVGDAVYLIEFIFKSGSAPQCP